MIDGAALLPPLGAAGAEAGAAGAPVGQLLALSAVYLGGTAGLLWLVHSHRNGRSQVLERGGRGAAFVFRVPGWAALPVTVSALGLILAMWGGLWDIGYHIDHGRDDGPLGNPAHWPMLAGLFLAFAGGVLCLGMAEQRDAAPSWVRLGRGWRVPVGGALLAGCMAFSLATLGLDDVWHRIFGEDVTLWSPPHFMFLFGGILSVIGMLVLLREGGIARSRRTRHRRGQHRSAALALWIRVQRVALLGGLLCGISLFLAEYDWGVPLYRQVWQPLILAAAAALIFTTARTWGGRGGALGAWAVFALLRATGMLIPWLAGTSPPSMPLLLASALLVELLALRIDPRRSPLAFGALAGLACGTIGFAGEYAWSQVAMPLPWTPALLPEALLLTTTAGVAGGLLGALIAASLRGSLPPPSTARLALLAAFSLLAGSGIAASLRHVPDVRAQVELTDVRPPPDRTATATVRLQPADAAERANWLYMLAWQGGEARVVDRLEQTGPGTYRSTRPIPLSGSWKVGLRLQRGRERGAVPIRLPADDALPGSTQTLPATMSAAELERALTESAGAELPAPAFLDRPFGDDNLIVLRETRGDVPGWLWSAALALAALVWGLFTALLVLGLARLGRRSQAPEAEAPPPRRPVPTPRIPA